MPLDTLTLEKIALELESMTPEDRELIHKALSEIPPASSQPVEPPRPERSEPPEEISSGLDASAQPDPAPTDAADAVPNPPEASDRPRIPALAYAQPAEEDRFRIAALASVDRPAVSPLSPRSSSFTRKHYAVTVIACVLTAAATFAGTNAWRARAPERQPAVPAALSSSVAPLVKDAPRKPDLYPNPEMLNSSKLDQSLGWEPGQDEPPVETFAKAPVPDLKPSTLPGVSEPTKKAPGAQNRRIPAKPAPRVAAKPPVQKQSLTRARRSVTRIRRPRPDAARRTRRTLGPRRTVRRRPISTSSATQPVRIGSTVGF